MNIYPPATSLFDVHFWFPGIYKYYRNQFLYHGWLTLMAGKMFQFMAEIVPFSRELSSGIGSLELAISLLVKPHVNSSASY